MKKSTVLTIEQRINQRIQRGYEDLDRAYKSFGNEKKQSKKKGPVNVSEQSVDLLQGDIEE